MVAAAILTARAYPSILMDAADKRLCDLIQNDFPLVERPYAAAGEQLEMGEDEVLERVTRLRERADHPPGLGDLRHPPAGLPCHRWSPPARSAERADEAAAVINDPPRRDAQLRARARVQHLVHASACRPNSQLGLDRTIELLGELAEVEVIRPLPALRFFKIGVDLDMKGGRDPAAKKARRAPGRRRRRRRRR